MTVQFKNNATSFVEGPLLAADTSVTIRLADAARFPVLADGDWHPLTLTDSLGHLEVVRVTARTSNVLTIVRAQEGTTAENFPTGARAELRLTAGAIAADRQALVDMIDDLSENIRVYSNGTVNLYVRPNGSNSNDGMSDTDQGAFLTHDAAIEKLRKRYDAPLASINIWSNDGGSFPPITRSVGTLVGKPQVTMKMAADTAEVAIVATSGECIKVEEDFKLYLDGSVGGGFKLDGSGGANHCLRLYEDGICFFRGVKFAGAASSLVYATRDGRFDMYGDCSVSIAAPILFDVTHKGNGRHSAGTMRALANLNFSDAVFRTDSDCEIVLTGSAAYDENGFAVTGYKGKAWRGDVQAAAFSPSDLWGDKMFMELGGYLMLSPASDIRLSRGTTVLDMAAYAGGETITFASNVFGQLFYPRRSHFIASVIGQEGLSEGWVETLHTAAGGLGGQAVNYLSRRRSDRAENMGGSTYLVNYAIDGSNSFRIKDPLIKLDGTGLTATVEIQGAPTGDLSLKWMLDGRS